MVVKSEIGIRKSAMSSRSPWSLNRKSAIGNRQCLSWSLNRKSAIGNRQCLSWSSNRQSAIGNRQSFQPLARVGVVVVGPQQVERSAATFPVAGLAFGLAEGTRSVPAFEELRHQLPSAWAVVQTDSEMNYLSDWHMNVYVTGLGAAVSASGPERPHRQSGPGRRSRPRCRCRSRRPDWLARSPAEAEMGPRPGGREWLAAGRRWPRIPAAEAADTTLPAGKV